MLVDRFLRPISLGGLYAGRAAFLLGPGPSLTTQNLMLLSQRGVLTMAIDGASALYRPHLWMCAEESGAHLAHSWYDPGILKFVPVELFENPVSTRPDAGAAAPTSERVRDMPGVFGYQCNDVFVDKLSPPERVRNEPNSSQPIDELVSGGPPSALAMALGLLCYLGVRRVYLLGCEALVPGDNSWRTDTNAKLAKLHPSFLKEGFAVFNCTPGRILAAFSHLPFQEALSAATAEMLLGINPADLPNRQAPALGLSPMALKGESGSPSAAEACLPIDFTTVVSVDQQQLEELKLVWPTWRQHRPEILRQPLLFVCDGALSDAEWQECLGFVDHAHKRIVRWDLSGVSQHEKMLSGLVFVTAREVQTPWYLRLDTKTVAAKSGPWLRAEWFGPDDHGRLPAFVAPPERYTRPADLLARLDEWGDGVQGLQECSRLDLPINLKRNRVRAPRVSSWCFLGNTAWTQEMAGRCPGRLPVPSDDTFLWYCARRRGDFYRAVDMRPAWAPVPRRRRLAAACRQYLGAMQTARPVTGLKAHNRGVMYLLTGARHAVRLAVSLWSLRQHYNGPVTLYTTLPASHAIGKRLAADCRLRLEHRPAEQVSRTKNATFLTKLALLPGSPYETTLFLDADTLITDDVAPLFVAAEEVGFAATQFADWVTSGPKMRHRISAWRLVQQDLFSPADFARLLDEAMAKHPAINSGVVAFSSGTPLLSAWQRLTEAGQGTFICDEIALQILLRRFSHCLLDCRFNYSPLYAPEVPRVHVWHFHGDKHLQAGRARNRWLPVFEECLQVNVGDIRAWLPAGDEALQKHLEAKLKVVKP